MLSRRESSAGRWLITGVLVLLLAGVPFFIAAFCVGWAKRWMADALHKFTFSHRVSRVPLKACLPQPNEPDDDYLETRSYA